MTLLNGKEEEYPHDGDAMKVNIGGHGEQMVEAVSLNSFYEKVQRHLAWMTLPEIEDVIIAMQTAPTGEQASPYLTELQARISFSHHHLHLHRRRHSPRHPDATPRNLLRHHHRGLGIVLLYYYVLIASRPRPQGPRRSSIPSSSSGRQTSSSRPSASISSTARTGSSPSPIPHLCLSKVATYFLPLFRFQLTSSA